MSLLDLESVKVLLSGSFAGACSTVAGAPFDTLKTRLQTNSKRFRNLTHCLVRTVRDESPLSLYKGVSPALASAVIENSVVFACNSGFQRLAKAAKTERGLEAQLSLRELAVIGGLSGVFSATAICPAEVCKVRMQAQLSGNERRFANSWDCVRQTVREGGLRGLFRGLPAQIARDVPFNFAFFGAYETFCKGFCALRGARNKSELGSLDIIAAGGFAGIVGWSVSLPMDVLKSQMQSHRVNEQATSMREPLTAVVRRIWATQGLRGFFKGWTAVAVRAFPCNGALFIGYETCNRSLERSQLFSPAPSGPAYKL